MGRKPCIAKTKPKNERKMNEEQNLAHGLAVNGHNLLLLGPAGTGKSYVVSEIYRTLTDSGVNVQITCSTGIACSVYTGLNPCTVHRYLGLEDGRYSPDRINDVHSNSGHYRYVFDNLRKVQCLIVDECSMISRHTFECIISVCKTKEEKLQLIFVGDFFQLPPVANLDYHDSGEFCFQSPYFSVFQHSVTLKKFHRTNDDQLLSAITDVFSGKLSPGSQDFILSMKRPLPPSRSAVSVKLFAKNDLVNDYNRTSLLNFPGDLYEYKSNDSGRVKELFKVTAPEILWIKLGCPVILLKNLTGKLVNGLMGHIQDINNKGLVVEFPSLHLTTTIERTNFTVFSPSMNKNIAERQQFPLKPAFAVTIHKAQGMSLSSVEIDCRDIFRPGQLGVALSRVTSSDGLHVINFHPRYVMTPPVLVTTFMTKDHHAVNIPANHTCCQSLTVQCSVTSRDGDDSLSSVQGTEQNPLEHGASTSGVTGDQAVKESQPDGVDAEVGETLSEDELGSEDELRSDDEFQNILDTVATEESKNFDIPFTMDDLIEKLLIKKEVTDSQKKINEIVSKVDNNLLEVFVRKLFVKFSEFANSISDNDEELSKGVPEKKLNAFYKIVHQYNTSSEYKMNCLLLFEREVFLDEHMMICYDILEEVRVPVLQKKVDLLKISGGHISRRYVTNASHARIRYVAGYCVSTLRKRYTRTKKLKLYDKRKEGQIQYKQSKCNLSIIDCLKEDEHYLEETTTVPLSLMDMKRKQRQSCSLTNVTDKMFLFFIHLTDLIIQLLVNENLLKHGKELYTYCFTTVHDNKKLHEEFINLLVNKSVEEEFQEFDFDEDVGCQQSKFSALLDDIVLQADQMNRVFKDIVMLYLNVLLAQFRRDVKSANKLEKKMAHRKQIKIKGKEPKASKISKSKSKSLKAKSKKNQKKSVNIPSESEENYTDTEDNTETSVKTGKPQELCVTSATSTVGASACVDNLEELSNMERLEQQQTPEKPSDAEGLEEDDNEDICNRCQTEKNDQWIQCDSCSSWFHRRCAGLQHNKKWGKFQKEGVNWFCLDCE